MKAVNIKSYETGRHCFGEILKINGVDYEDLKKEDVVGFINEMMEEDINSDTLTKDLLKVVLEYLQLELAESSHDKCEQCGDWNEYAKFENR